MPRIETDLNYLSEFANEGGTFPITLTFYDEDGDEGEVTAINWRLTNKNGTVINDRGNESIISPGNPQVITLEGADLELSSGFTGQSEERRLGVKVTYNSTLGTGKVEYDECVFYIKNLAVFPWGS